MTNLKIVSIGDCADITLDDQDFGISIEAGRDEDDNDVLHLLLILSNCAKIHIGDIRKPTDQDATFVPWGCDKELAKQQCNTCNFWKKTTITPLAYLRKCTCDLNLVSAVSTPDLADLLTTGDNWCCHWARAKNDE